MKLSAPDLGPATRRRLRLSAFALVGLMAGVILSFLIGNWVIASDRNIENFNLARQYVDDVDAVDDEALSTLQKINDLTLEHCSDAELAVLRQMVVNSRFLKSAARFQGDTMPCNSLVGRLPATTKPVISPDFETQHGYGIYIDAPLTGIPGARGVIIRHKNASVVINKSAFFSSFSDPDVDAILAIDTHDGGVVTIRAGELISTPVSTRLATGVPAWIDGERHEVACSRRYPQCVIARMTVTDSARQDNILLSFAFMGAIAGLASGVGTGVVVAQRGSLGNRLRTALRGGEISLVYQPVVSLSDRKIVSLEVLARWRTADGEYIRPDLFVAAAEQNGLIVELTKYVIRHALREMAPLLRQRPELSIAVNIAAEDLLMPDFCDFVASLCDFHQIAPHCLNFEITERSTIEMDHLREGINKLRAAGHGIYIDDFGIAYSNLSYLVDLHVDAIKLDRAITSSICGGGKGAIVAAKIAGMVADLNMNMVVEGIETEEQATYFSSLPGALRGQGWLFGKPAPASTLMPTLLPDSQHRRES